MCNRFRASSVVRIRDAFGFTYIESGPPREPRYNLSYIAPLKLGPFVRAGHSDFDEGQWGLTPAGSKTLRPTRADGKPMSTNNARWDARRGEPEKRTFKDPWWESRRCIVPAEDFDEPWYPEQSDERDGPSVWMRFRRADGDVLGIAGLWNEWRDPETGEILTSFTMVTINCDAHPQLKLLHKPERDKATRKLLPPQLQDKRTVVPLERSAWDAWLHGTREQAAALITLPTLDLYLARPADPTVQLELPVRRT